MMRARLSRLIPQIQVTWRRLTHCLRRGRVLRKSTAQSFDPPDLPVGLGGPGALPGRDRMRHPRPIAAALVGALDGDPVIVEPQRYRALAPAVDAIDDRDLRAALEAGRHL